MPLFNRTFASESLAAELIDGANAAYDLLTNRKIPEIILADPVTGLIVPNLVGSYLQAHLRRCLTFAEAGAAEINSGRPLAAELCSRALYENIATICDFADKLKPLCDAGDYRGVEQYVSRAAFITRIPALLDKHGDEVKAPQILNLIDAMNKRYPAYRNAYDHLSDIVHPNGMGAVIYFTKIEPGKSVFVDDAVTPERAKTSIVCATFLLLFVEVVYTQVEELLAKLATDVVARREA
jgi:hypothetical protein